VAVRHEIPRAQTGLNFAMSVSACAVPEAVVGAIAFRGLTNPCAGIRWMPASRSDI